MSVLFLPEISNQFVELAEILYDKGYMSFLDAAIEYSESLFREIQSNLPIKVHRKAPAYFNLLSYSSRRHVAVLSIQLY